MKRFGRLFVDIETAPNEVMIWRTGYNLTVDHASILKERAIVAIGYSWDGEKTVHCLAWDHAKDDREMLIDFWPVLARADEIVGHNVKRFDLPWLRTRYLFHRLHPIPPVAVVDTCIWAKSHFYLNSNSLAYLSKFLGFGGKVKTTYDLWVQTCAKNDRAALRRMMFYCREDVRQLKKVYARLAEVAPHHTNLAVWSGLSSWRCPHCKSAKVGRIKVRVTPFGITRHQMQCKACHRYFTISDKTHLAMQKEEGNDEAKTEK